jgi:hypothetical protein
LVTKNESRLERRLKARAVRNRRVGGETNAVPGVVGRWATEVQESKLSATRGEDGEKEVGDWTTGTNDGGRQAKRFEGRKCTEQSRSDMRHV